MAVFTRVSEQQLQGLLEDFFPQPEVVDFQGISAGIENTNYFVDLYPEPGAAMSRWVLTLFEMVSREELPVFVSLTQQLATQGLPVPAALRDRHGNSIHTLSGKPCILVPRVPGKQLQTPTVSACREVGKLVAQLHLAAKDTGEYRAVVRNQDWLELHQQQLAGDLSAEDTALLGEEIRQQKAVIDQWQSLPRGWIHGDLFVDNVLFDQGRVSGIIDFYHACHDAWLMDLAVACNDWCYQTGSGYVPERMAAFLQGYHEVRSLTAAEQQCWSLALRLAALRFWLSRLSSLHGESYQQNAAQGEVFKNPDEMKEKLLAARSARFPSLH